MDTRAWNVIHDARRCQRPILNIRSQRKIDGGRRMFIDDIRITVLADFIALPYGKSALYRNVYTRNFPYVFIDLKNFKLGNDIDIGCIIYRVIINCKTQAPAAGQQPVFQSNISPPL